MTFASTNGVTKMQSIMLDRKLMGATDSLWGTALLRASGANHDCMTIWALLVMMYYAWHVLHVSSFLCQRCFAVQLCFRYA